MPMTATPILTYRAGVFEISYMSDQRMLVHFGESRRSTECSDLRNPAEGNCEFAGPARR